MGISTVICPHCAHQWVPRVANPQTCPKCKKRLPEAEKGGEKP